MTTRKPKQPVVWVEEETPLEEALSKMTDGWIEAGNYCEETIATLRDACKWLLAGRAAAADSDDARDERGTRSQQRVGRLLARWREKARELETLADECDDLDEERDAAECRERALTFRECAADIEREWAGTEPISTWQDHARTLERELAELTRERDALKTDALERLAALCPSSEELAQVTRERDEAKIQLEKTNLGFGCLAPNGTWLCEVMENIWRADSVDAAKAEARKVAERISTSGLWVGDRAVEAERDAALAKLKTCRDALKEIAFYKDPEDGMTHVVDSFNGLLAHAALEATK